MCNTLRVLYFSFAKFDLNYTDTSLIHLIRIMHTSALLFLIYWTIQIFVLQMSRWVTFIILFISFQTEMSFFFYHNQNIP